MSMSKKDFIALADKIKEYNASAFPAGTNTYSPLKFQHTQLLALMDFCQRQNPRFNRERWLGYIAGTNGPNGGVVKHVWIRNGYCKVCGHYGDDCTGKRSKRDAKMFGSSPAEAAEARS